jgi:hypothetical protein
LAPFASPSVLDRRIPKTIAVGPRFEVIHGEGGEFADTQCAGVAEQDEGGVAGATECSPVDGGHDREQTESGWACRTGATPWVRRSPSRTCRTALGPRAAPRRQQRTAVRTFFREVSDIDEIGVPEFLSKGRSLMPAPQRCRERTDL